MPIFVTQGRYSESAIKAMLVRPEDRAAAVAKLIEKAGGHLIDYYVLFGEYDWMVIYEVPSGKEAAAIVLTAMGAGAVTGTKTMLAMTTIDAKAAFEAARPSPPPTRLRARPDGGTGPLDPGNGISLAASSVVSQARGLFALWPSVPHDCRGSSRGATLWLRSRT